MVDGGREVQSEMEEVGITDLHMPPLHWADLLYNLMGDNALR